MYKRFLMTALMFCGISWASWGGTPLGRGTALQVRIVEPIDSKTMTEAVAVVEYDVKANGKVLIRNGTPVQMQVQRKKARGIGRPGSLSVRVLSTQAADGQTILLSGGVLKVEGQSNKCLAIGLGVGLGFFVWPCLGCLAIKGEQAEIEAGTVLNNVLVASDCLVE